jgi:hypothetical protein
MNLDTYVIKENIKHIVTCFCLKIIKKINKRKDYCLTQKLFDLAEYYNTCPGTNNYATVRPTDINGNTYD